MFVCVFVTLTTIVFTLCVFMITYILFIVLTIPLCLMTVSVTFYHPVLSVFCVNPKCSARVVNNTCAVWHILIQFNVFCKACVNPAPNDTRVH